MKNTLVILFALWFFDASGISYYVSANGNDINKGTKWVFPFKTIQKAASLTRPGDTVFIMKGDYYSNNESLLHIERSGNEKDGWIVFKNYLNHKPVLHVKNKNGIWIQSSGYISIEGLTIVPETSDSITFRSKTYTGILIDGTYESPCAHLKIFNNFIQKMPGNGLMANYFDYLTISYNKFYSNAQIPDSKAAIFLKNLVDVDGRAIYHNFIQANTLEKNGFNALACHPAILMEYEFKNLTNSNSKTLVHNNILYLNGGGGISIKGALGINVINNTLYKNSESNECKEGEIVIANCSGLNVLNNIFYTSTAKPGNVIMSSADIRFQNNLYYNFSAKEKGENDLVSNPEFELINDKEGVYNFRLKGNSPAINAGTDELLSDIDFEGNKRKMDTHVDLGALEFTNRILPSLKNTKAGPQAKGIKSTWTSLYTKDQKVYTIWNQQNQGFSVRMFDGQGNLLFEKIRSDESENSFEIDFNPYSPGFYTVYVFNAASSHVERIRVQDRTKAQ
jgi:hypothetical protein